jgi:hypothetical protein
MDIGTYLNCMNPLYCLHLYSFIGLYISILDMNSSKVKSKMDIFNKYNFAVFNLLHICLIDEHHVAVVVLGTDNDVLLIFSTDKSQNMLSHEDIDENIKSIAVNGDSVYVGFQTGQIARVNKKHLLKGKFLREMVRTQTKLQRPVMSMIFDANNVLFASGRYLYQYPLFFSNREADGLIKHLHPEQSIDQLVLLPGARQFAAFFQCAPEVHIVNLETFNTTRVISFGYKLLELNPCCEPSDRRVTSICAVYDVLWLGTGSGHIFIYDISQDDQQPRLLTVFQPYIMELRKLCLWKVAQNKDKHGVEYLVISTGKELNPLVFSNKTAKTLCELASGIPVEEKCRSSKRKSPTPTVTSDNENSNYGIPEEKVILMWHAADANTMRQYLADY